jgi:hypothetical protein
MAEEDSLARWGAPKLFELKMSASKTRLVPGEARVKSFLSPDGPPDGQSFLTHGGFTAQESSG